MPVLSKVFERLLVEQLKSHLSINKILPEKQSGFRNGYGCSAALLDVTDDIIKSVDDGSMTVLVLLDYSRAFDTINHELLLSILHYIGLGHLAVRLFSCYVHDRYQRVKLGGSYSDLLPVASGVPQGSILGPLLYTIYTSSLFNCIRDCKYQVYADDTQLHFSFKSSEALTSAQLINSDLQRLVKNSEQHQLFINADKCSAMLFGCKRNRNLLKPLLNIEINNFSLPFVDSARNLGIIFDSDLRFKAHITKLIQRSYSVLKLLYSNRHILNKFLRRMLCDSLVLSHFNFCDVLYHSCIDSADGDRIQRVQNSCLRFICGLRRRDRISCMVVRMGWMNMSARRRFHSACFYYRVIITCTPPYLYNKIKFRTDVHTLNLRHKSTITVPKHRLEMYKRSFSYGVASVFNSIPNNLKTSFAHFRRGVKLLFSGCS